MKKGIVLFTLVLFIFSFKSFAYTSEQNNIKTSKSLKEIFGGYSFKKGKKEKNKKKFKKDLKKKLRKEAEKKIKKKKKK